jgi:ER lumen protein retaining receptor
MRYMDLFMYFVSLYNTLMKLFFISSTVLAIYLMRYKKPYCTTYDAIGDSFPHLMVLLPTALVLTCVVNSGWTPWEMCWSYSLWLEAMAFIPQIVMLNKIRIIENITGHYVVALGLYRAFYIFNW